jgi:hypothetical protein
MIHLINANVRAFCSRRVGQVMLIFCFIRRSFSVGGFSFSPNPADWRDWVKLMQLMSFSVAGLYSLPAGRQGSAGTVAEY